MATDPLELPMPTTTADRLRRIADIIDTHPNQWDQGNWVGEHCTPETAAGTASECGTTSCIAGWAVRLAEPSDVQRLANAKPSWTVMGEWVWLGMNLLGLHEETALRLFYDETAEVVDSNLLRRLADLPEGKRTLPAVGLELAW